MINAKEYVNFIVKNKLTQTQFLMLQLIYERDWDSIRKYKKAFPSDDGSMIGSSMLQDLVKRGFLIPLKKDAEKAADYKLGKEFLSIFVDKYQAIRELVTLYPKYLTTNSGRLPLAVIDIDTLAEVYWKKINKSRDAHEEIKKDIEFGVSNGLLRYKLESFIRGEMWNIIRPEREHNDVTTISDNSKITDDDF